jgi:hypothetical protein
MEYNRKFYDSIAMTLADVNSRDLYAVIDCVENYFSVFGKFCGDAHKFDEFVKDFNGSITELIKSPYESINKNIIVSLTTLQANVISFVMLERISRLKMCLPDNILNNPRIIEKYYLDSCSRFGKRVLDNLTLATRQENFFEFFWKYYNRFYINCNKDDDENEIKEYPPYNSENVL